MNQPQFSELKIRSTALPLVLTLLLILLCGLFLFGPFETLRSWLEQTSWTVPAIGYEISSWKIVYGSVAVVFVFLGAITLSRLIASALGRVDSLGASNRTLLIKAAQIAVYTLLFLIMLDLLGIDLTTLTVFGGALGIGIGFGLQKITSNFISGIILLSEKSVEQDDLLELDDGTFGFVRETSTRYTLLETFDGKEILVPNEDLITSRVVNWTYTKPNGRVQIDVGVSYESDIALARDLMLAAATEHPRCSTEPAPQCFLIAFADSSVNFTLYFWLDDITAGRRGPQSEVMFAIWNKFAENDITIPFPQRDLHVKNWPADNPAQTAAKTEAESENVSHPG
jgi:small-conductance mechanosensitive channel